MALGDTFAVAAAVVTALGGGGVIVLALSSWLGKLWANRLMEHDRVEHAQHLERLRASLRAEHDDRMSRMDTALDIYKDRFLKAHHDKLATYRMAVDMIATLLADLDRSHRLSPEQAAVSVDTFNRDRIRLYGYLGMLAPQQVMDAQDALIDYLLLIVHRNAVYEWAKVRDLALKLLNEVRKDVGIDQSPIEYRGNL